MLLYMWEKPPLEPSPMHLFYQCSHLSKEGPLHRISWYLYAMGADGLGVGCPFPTFLVELGRCPPGPPVSGPSSQQSRWLTSFSSSAERELGQILLTDGIGEVQNRRASRDKSHVQKQLADVLSYRQAQLQCCLSALQGRSRLNSTVSMTFTACSLMQARDKGRISSRQSSISTLSFTCIA